ncbi:hypothetical protein BC826DRAFT_1075631, partial [Russula brevipes]
QTRARFQLRCSTLLHTSTPSASPRCCSEPANHSAEHTNPAQTPFPPPLVNSTRYRLNAVKVPV